MSQNEVKPWMTKAAAEIIDGEWICCQASATTIPILAGIIARNAPAEGAPDSVGSPQKPTSSSTSASLTRPVSSDVAPDREETGAHLWHDSVGEAPAAQKETAQTQSGIMPLTYEQEVHSILWAAAAITGDLILCFKAQAARETGETKKLTQKCIAWREDDLRRIKALIPQALERRDAAPAQSLYEAPIEWINEDELPEGYPYEAMFPLSKLGHDGRGGVRIFPKFPQGQSSDSWRNSPAKEKP